MNSIIIIIIKLISIHQDTYQSIKNYLYTVKIKIIITYRNSYQSIKNYIYAIKSKIITNYQNTNKNIKNYIHTLVNKILTTCQNIHQHIENYKYTAKNKIITTCQDIFQNIKNRFNLSENDKEILCDFLINLLSVIIFIFWITYLLDFYIGIFEHSAAVDFYRSEATKYQQNCRIIDDLSAKLNSKLDTEMTNNTINIGSILFAIMLIILSKPVNHVVNNFPALRDGFV